MTSINNYFTLKITKDKRKIGQKIKERCTVKEKKYIYMASFKVY